tara:strand:- start:341 stop:1045 length:705 start_codon:yes stop_codon:yes gene_type:complete
MKKLLLLLFIPFLSFGQDLTYVPDNNFEQYLIDSGYDDVLDDYVLSSNINTLSTFTIMSSIDQPVFDITGIRDFTLLKTLYVTNNYLNELDLSGMFYLEDVYVSGNYITCVNTSNCPSLYTLHIDNNFLSQIDISENNSLQWFKADGNPDLDCIQVNEDNLPGYFWYDFATTTYSEDCDYTEVLDCSNVTSVDEIYNNKSLIKNIDILGRETNNKGLQLHIYDDGSVEKKYLIK